MAISKGGDPFNPQFGLPEFYSPSRVGSARIPRYGSQMGYATSGGPQGLGGKVGNFVGDNWQDILGAVATAWSLYQSQQDRNRDNERLERQDEMTEEDRAYARERQAKADAEWQSRAGQRQAFWDNPAVDTGNAFAKPPTQLPPTMSNRSLTTRLKRY